MKRIAIFFAVAMTCMAGMAPSILLPTPSSPPLVNHSGVRLDEDSAADLTELVFQAARENDVVTVHAYLREGFSPNVRSKRGDTLLTVAAYYDSIDIVRTLLNHRHTDIEARNRMGLTAVAAAGFKGHDNSNSAVDVARAQGAVEVVQYLSTGETDPTDAPVPNELR